MTSSGTSTQTTSASLAPLEVAGREAVGRGLLAGGVGPDAHPHVAAGVAQVQRPRAALVPVADHRDRGARERAQVGVVVVKDRRHGREGRPEPVAPPVRISASE